MRRTGFCVVAIGAAVGLAGDACHVAAGTTRYEWDGVPVLWRSAIWFPLLLAGAVLALALLGRGRGAPRSDPWPGIAAVLALYALTAALRGQPVTVGVVLVSALAVLIWRWWDPAGLTGAVVAAVAGPLAEIAIVHAGASSYASDSDELWGVAPWLPALYFAAGAVAWRLWDVLERK